jgi:hypothetical protein
MPRGSRTPPNLGGGSQPILVSHPPLSKPPRRITRRLWPLASDPGPASRFVYLRFSWQSQLVFAVCLTSLFRRCWLIGDSWDDLSSVWDSWLRSLQFLCNRPLRTKCHRGISIFVPWLMRGTSIFVTRLMMMYLLPLVVLSLSPEYLGKLCWAFSGRRCECPLLAFSSHYYHSFFSLIILIFPQLLVTKLPSSFCIEGGISTQSCELFISCLLLLTWSKLMLVKHVAWCHCAQN